MTTESNAKKRSKWRRFKALAAESRLKSCILLGKHGPMRGSSLTYARRTAMPKYCNWDCPAFKQCFDKLGIPTGCPMGKKRRGDRKKAACVECKLLGRFKCPWSDKYD
jgi:hypothetical protein